MDTIVVGVFDPKPGTCTSRMVSVRPVAEVPSGRQLGLLFGRQVLAAVRPDQQPRRARARGGTLGVVGQRRDPVQRRVHPQATGYHRDDEQDQQRQHASVPNTVCAEAFSASAGPAAAAETAAPPVGACAAGPGDGPSAGAGVCAAAGATARAGGVGGFGGHGGGGR